MADVDESAPILPTLLSDMDDTTEAASSPQQENDYENDTQIIEDNFGPASEEPSTQPQEQPESTSTLHSASTIFYDAPVQSMIKTNSVENNPISPLETPAALPTDAPLPIPAIPMETNPAPRLKHSWCYTCAKPVPIQIEKDVVSCELCKGTFIEEYEEVEDQEPEKDEDDGDEEDEDDEEDEEEQPAMPFSTQPAVLQLNETLLETLPAKRKAEDPSNSSPSKKSALIDDAFDAWSCNSCTFLNEPLWLQCEVCGAERPPKKSVPKPSRSNSADIEIISTWVCKVCTLVNEGGVYCDACGSPAMPNLQGAPIPIVEKKPAKLSVVAALCKANSLPAGSVKSIFNFKGLGVKDEVKKEQVAFGVKQEQRTHNATVEQQRIKNEMLEASNNAAVKFEAQFSKSSSFMQSFPQPSPSLTFQPPFSANNLLPQPAASSSSMPDIKRSASLPLPLGTINNLMPTLPETGYQAHIAANQVQENEAINTIFQGLQNNAAATTNELPTPPGMTVELMKHQRLGLFWLSAQENNPNYRGGLLADEMGLGKTIQTLALILHEKSAIANLSKTLIVGPVAVLQQWYDEITTKTNAGLRVGLYHGNRSKRLDWFQRYDIVITSYNIVAAEAEKRTKKGELTRAAGLLFKTHWFRVVLDEAHMIKNRDTQAHIGACALKAERRWALTGTPIQNSLDDAFSLFHFLGVKPYNDIRYFRKHIAPSRNARARINKDNLQKLQIAMKGITLRRCKDAKIDGRPLLDLPPRTVDIMVQPFSEPERDFYDAFEKKAKIKFNGYLRAGTVVKNYANILALLVRLRQACDHPSLIPVPVAGEIPEDAENAVASRLSPEVLERLLNEEIAADCPICFEPLEKPMTTLCGHVFCSGCIGTISKDQSKCPICRQTVKDVIDMADLLPKEDVAKSTNSSAAAAPLDNKRLSSTKIEMVLATLSDTRQKNPKTKTIVFTFFTGFITLLEDVLYERGFRFERYTGSMTRVERVDALERFRQNDDTTVLLMSLRAGCLGLNLTCASHVIICDPWWNPQVENQAIDRAHRIGQKEEVFVKRLLIKDSVEERIAELQERKSQLAAGALGDSAISDLTRLSVDDLKYLFRGDRFEMPLMPRHMHHMDHDDDDADDDRDYHDDDDDD